MYFGGPDQPRVIGDYILGPRIGRGSFAEVWRARHRHSGLEVAVKEIDKTRLSQKVDENLLKEISILRTIDHPNIIRLFEAIQTHDRIFLVLEYCGGGDLAAYIHHYGKVSEAIARHFMRQLATGLQVLQEKHLIHRDLKPQNLLLATTEAMPLLKIGDFGFARSLTHQELADTQCGSPLYMAPEIIQNQKYDAKADLWSAGAILFQLVIGRPPFEGNNQLQLFQNVLTSTELQFPLEDLTVIHSDCLDLCRGLLRQNPVERLTFKEFFDHRFLQEPRSTVNVEESSLSRSETLMVSEFDISASDKMSHLHSGYDVGASVNNAVVTSSIVSETMLLQRKNGGDTSGTKSVQVLASTIAYEGRGKSLDGGAHLSNMPIGLMLSIYDVLILLSFSLAFFFSQFLSLLLYSASPLVESIERGYVFVNAHLASVVALSDYFEASKQANTASRVFICPLERNDLEIGVKEQAMDAASSSANEAEKSKSYELEASALSYAFAVLGKVQGISSMHPSNRLELLYLYVQILVELSQEKYNEGLYLESFAVELVILAIWKKALEICQSWLSSPTEVELSGSTSLKNSALVRSDVGLSHAGQYELDFQNPPSVYLWAKQGFICAVDRTEKLLSHIQNIDGAAEMPDAMEIIFQRALSVGKSGAVDEFIENRGRAAVSYLKAMLLLSFILGEAVHLPLKPPFALTPANKKRIWQYIVNLQSHHLHSSSSEPLSKAGV